MKVPLFSVAIYSEDEGKNLKAVHEYLIDFFAFALS